MGQRSVLWKVIQQRDRFRILSPLGMQEAECFTFDDVLSWMGQWEAEHDSVISFEYSPA